MDINATLIGQIITFSLLVIFTMKFVWPPLRKAMEDRKNMIASGLKAAKDAKCKLQEANLEANTIVENARIRASKMIDQASISAAQIKEDAKKDARVSAEKIILAAKSETKSQLHEVKQKLKEEVVLIAIKGAEKLISRNIDTTADRHILDNIAAEL